MKRTIMQPWDVMVQPAPLVEVGAVNFGMVRLEFTGGSPVGVDLGVWPTIEAPAVKATPMTMRVRSSCALAAAPAVPPRKPSPLAADMRRQAEDDYESVVRGWLLPAGMWEVRRPGVARALQGPRRGWASGDALHEDGVRAFNLWAKRVLTVAGEHAWRSQNVGHGGAFSDCMACALVWVVQAASTRDKNQRLRALAAACALADDYSLPVAVWALIEGEHWEHTGIAVEDNALLL